MRKWAVAAIVAASIFAASSSHPGARWSRAEERGLQAGTTLRLEDVLRRTGAWVERFADDSVYVVADERYEQEYRARHGSSWDSERRRLVSEVAMVRTLDDEARRGHPWVQFRDVVEVDGQPLADHRGRLERLFRQVSGSSYTQARTLIEESARFNVGPFVREINVPAFALFFLHPRNQGRCRFSLKGTESVEGVTAAVITFAERERPTMIRSARREDRPARGTIWADPATGRVVKTDLVVEADRRWITDTEVTFGAVSRLNLWLPLVMRERHHRGSEEFIDGTATYSGFRRFETDARMVGPR